MIFKLGILASGNGTDLDAIYKEIDEGKMPGIEVVIVLSNVEGAPVLGKADARGLRAEFVNPKGKSKEDYDLELVSLMKEAEVDLVCLIGYMKVLTPVFVREFPRHIINVHPALLPKYGGHGWYGMKVHEEVLKNHEKETGMTVHYVDYGVDSGAMILQEKVAVAPDDTPETLKVKVQALEKKAYPEAIRLICKERTGKLGG
ncbi:phosphoribosylglycinamide formyltransferase [Candidatus Peregrinibacteria bacterium RIFCSPLOWO2_02_FULL_48_14]|nr:MAG: phosphoribosylglycinamide formyltransferase [Candidatus Peregrinibacteria bacterium RIFCSPLOWO2_01_FULL_48_20]OGJ46343.1 MAG: phosphoribosylglycinamide formyltransferase [Candidatus Peregrinibacteria bacterium RIFCSPLOWO2_02_FULL_48_14]